MDLKSNVDRLKSYSSVLDFTLSSSISVAVSYTENLYPSDINMFDDIVRRRTNFTITNIWDDDRTKRSVTYGGKANSQGQAVPSGSTWPLDGHLNFATTSSVRIDDGAGELMNFYTSYSGSVPGASDQRQPMLPASLRDHRVQGAQMFMPAMLFGAGTQSGKKPYEDYSTYAEKLLW